MKKNFIRTVVCTVVFCAVGVAAYFGMPKEQERDLLLANVEALANDENKNKDKKISDSCACWTSTNNFVGMAILECEEYEWYPPMIKQYCVKRSCSSGACRSSNKKER